MYDYKTSSGDHELWLEGFTCSGTDCDTLSSPPTWGPDQLGDPLLVDELLAPGVTIHLDTNGDRYIHAVRRAKVVTDCDEDGVTYDQESSQDPDFQRTDLREQVWATYANGGSGGHVASRVVYEDPIGTSCDGNNVSFAKFRNNVYACWTQETGPVLTKENQVLCDERAVGGVWNDGGITRKALDNNNGAETHDHAWFDFDGSTTERIVAHREVANGERIQVNFLDRAGSPVVELDESGTGEDYPAIDVINGAQMLVAFHDEDGNTPDDLLLAHCDDASVDCTDALNWTTSPVHEANGIERAEFRSDGAKQFILFQMPYEVAPGVAATRAHVTWRCGTGSWSTPVVVDAGTPNDEWHELYHGRPHFSINTSDDILFIGLIERSSSLPNDLILVRAGYTACDVDDTVF